MYGRLERGVGLPSIGKLRELCAVLNVSSDTLLSLSPPGVTPPPVAPTESLELRSILEDLRGWPSDKLRLLRRVVKGLNAL